MFIHSNSRNKTMETKKLRIEMGRQNQWWSSSLHEAESENLRFFHTNLCPDSGSQGYEVSTLKTVIDSRVKIAQISTKTNKPNKQNKMRQQVTSQLLSAEAH